MKKWLTSLLVIMMIFCLSTLGITENYTMREKPILSRMEVNGLNQEDEEELNQQDMEEILQTSANLTEEPKINSKAAIVLERNTKQVLFEKNADKKVPMASTTKIMTILVVLENAKLSDMVTIEQKAAQTGRIAIRIKNER